MIPYGHPIYARGRFGDYWRIYVPFVLLQIFALAGLHPAASNIHHMNATMLITGLLALIGFCAVMGSFDMPRTDRLQAVLILTIMSCEFGIALLLKLGIAEYDFPIPFVVMFGLFVISVMWGMNFVVERWGGHRGHAEKQLMVGFFGIQIIAAAVDAYLVWRGFVPHVWPYEAIILGGWFFVGLSVPPLVLWWLARRTTHRVCC